MRWPMVALPSTIAHLEARLARYRAQLGGAAWVVGGLAIAYLVAYLGTPKLPGNDPLLPLGWWGWFDQSKTLQSVAAMARGDLSPAEHHYPLGFALLGLPFYFVLPNHSFFFVGLVSLLAATMGFVAVGRRLGLPPLVAAALFALVTLGDRALFLQWVVPWNTTPVGAFTWLLLANVAAWIDGVRRPIRIGVLMGAIAACRPSDAVVVLPCLLALAWNERRAVRPARWRTPGVQAVRMAAGALAVLLPVLAAHLAIYGPARSPYMDASAAVGFTLHDLGWKAYVLLVDPWPWFADGEGVLQHAPWVVLGLAGIVPALRGGPKPRVLALVLVVHSVFYIAYVDLLPTGLWRFLNIHYFVWSIPGYALLAALLLRDLVAPRGHGGWTRIRAGASLLATVLVLCLEVVPVPDGAAQAAKAVDFAGPPPSFRDTFASGRLALQDTLGVLHDTTDIRGFVYLGRVRVVALRRDIVGPVEWLTGHAPTGYDGSVATVRWVIGTRLAWPPRWVRRAPPSSIALPLS